MSKYYIEIATGILFYVSRETNDTITLINDERLSFTIRKCMLDRWFKPYQ